MIRFVDFSGNICAGASHTLRAPVIMTVAKQNNIDKQH